MAWAGAEAITSLTRSLYSLQPCLCCPEQPDGPQVIAIPIVHPAEPPHLYSEGCSSLTIFIDWLLNLFAVCRLARGAITLSGEGKHRMD
jgi:hypothetical protein